MAFAMRTKFQDAQLVRLVTTILQQQMTTVLAKQSMPWAFVEGLVQWMLIMTGFAMT
jgi:hypothetical protein